MLHPVVVPQPPEYAPDSVALDDGWIEWSGGECPVDYGSYVWVIFRDGEKSTTKEKAGNHFWINRNKHFDIVKWKLA